MPFWVFILVNATLFVRPTEVIPALDKLPIYNVLIVICLGLTLSKIVGLLSLESLRRSPLTSCVIGLFGMLLLSNLVRLDFTTTKDTGVEFLKVVLYYLMLLSVVDTPSRVRRFLTWVTIFAMIVAALALMQYHGVINIPALEALERVEYTDEGVGSVSMQLRSVGIYNDPNDLCLLLVVGLVISLYEIFERKGVIRVLWVGPLAVLFYALILTRSRGGFLALLVSLFVLFVNRFGWKKAIPLASIAMPALLLLSGGRQTEISVGQGTAQERMEKWKEGLILFTHRPLTGIGAGRYAEDVGLVAHNSYVHAYVEMGFPGGTLFVGLFYFAFEGLRSKYYQQAHEIDPAFLRLRPYLMAMVAGYAAGIFSLSRNYIVPTYMIFGIVAAFQQAAFDPLEPAEFCLNHEQGKRLLIAGVCVLVGIKVFLAVAAH